MLAVVSKSGPEALMTANYLLKDMVGQLGGIAYVSKLGSTIDKNPHQIAIRSIAYQQVAMFLFLELMLCMLQKKNYWKCKKDGA